MEGRQAPYVVIVEYKFKTGNLKDWNVAAFTKSIYSLDRTINYTLTIPNNVCIFLARVGFSVLKLPVQKEYCISFKEAEQGFKLLLKLDQ